MTDMRDRRDDLQRLACELLDISPEDCYFSIKSRGFGNWWMEYEKPRYPGDIGIKLGRYHCAKIKLREMLGNE